MRSRIPACALLLLLLGGCRVSLGDAMAPGPDASAGADVAAAASSPAGPAGEATLARLGPGAAPGDANGPGGFVPRGSLRNFYTGRGGRLWYYMNNYYWVPDSAPREDLWIKAHVVEEFEDLRTWPGGAPAKGPDPKVTAEYWRVGSTGRTVRLDNHRDFFLLEDQYTSGAITLRVTLTLGRLEVRDTRGRWGRSKQAYVLVSRNYSGGGGLGADRTRFVPLETEAVTVWGYRVPWSTHPQRLTRSQWSRLELPTWGLVERRLPPGAPTPGPVITPAGAAAAER